MGFSFTSPMAFLYHAFHHTCPETHVKASQTDFRVKPDTLSGPTHDSPSETPLRTKATFQHEKSTEKASRKATEAVRGPPKPGEDQPLSMLLPVTESGPRPEGQHRDQDVIPLLAQSHGRSFEATGQSPWLQSVRSPKLSRLGFDRSRLPIPWVGIGLPPARNEAPAREPSYFRYPLGYPARVSR